MRKLIAVVICFVLFYMARAQQQTKFYDYNWKECEPGKANFISLVRKTDSGWLRTDYYLPKKALQMQGLCKDNECTVKNGHFYYFHPNEKLMATGKYTDNKKEGLWLSYHSNGSLEDSAVYAAGRIKGSLVKWYSNGYMSDSLSFAGTGITQLSWFDDGNLASSGRLTPANAPTGKWQFFHHNGKLSSEEVYESGKLLSKTYYSENGNVTDTSNRDRPAEFKGGAQGWVDYLNAHLYWPLGTGLKNTDRVQIPVSFWIDEHGQLKDIELPVPFEDMFNSIVLKVLAKSPRWTPAVSHNRNILYRYRQLVGFQWKKE